MKFPVYVTAVLSLIATTSVIAADVVPNHILACVSLMRDAERLACFDRAVADVQRGTVTKAPSAENMFGATSETADPSSANREIKREELKEISALVTSLRPVDDGMIVIELDNGQSWRQQDKDVTLTIDVGDTVRVLRASLGTFRIADKRGRSARFKRLR